MATANDTMTTRDMLAFVAVSDVMMAHDLNPKIVEKQDSWLMKTCGLFLRPFNPNFMTSYTTTIPFLNTMYVPDIENPKWRTIAHESIHCLQARRDGQLKFALKYMFPQCLGPLAILAVGAIWWTPMLFALAFLAAFAPWPAKWRVNYELEAYRVSAIMDAIIGHDVRSPEYLSYMRNHYTGWGYYKMSWNDSTLPIRIVEGMIYAHTVAHTDSYIEDATPYKLQLAWAVKNALEGAA